MSIEKLRTFAPYFTPEDQEQLREWEKLLKQKNLYKTYLEHPITKEIITKILSMIKDINTQILNSITSEGKIDPRLVGQRESWIGFVELLSPGIADDSLVANDIDSKFKEFESYYKDVV